MQIKLGDIVRDAYGFGFVIEIDKEGGTYTIDWFQYSNGQVGIEKHVSPHLVFNWREAFLRYAEEIKNKPS